MNIPSSLPIYTTAYEALASVSQCLRVRRAVDALNAGNSFPDTNELRFITDPATRQIDDALLDRTTNAVLDVLPVTRVLQLAADLHATDSKKPVPEAEGPSGDLNESTALAPPWISTGSFRPKAIPR